MTKTTVKRSLSLAGLWLGLVLGTMTPSHAVELTLPDLDGKPHNLADYRGKWVVVNFWATWCNPCLEEIPDLVAFHSKHHQTDAVVIGINYEPEQSVDYLRQFAKELKINYPLLRGAAEAEKVLGPVMGMPTTFLIAPDGSTVATAEGVIDSASIEGFMADHKGQNTPK